MYDLLSQYSLNNRLDDSHANLTLTNDDFYRKNLLLHENKIRTTGT